MKNNISKQQVTSLSLRINTVACFILLIIMLAFPGNSSATSMFYAISPAAGSDRLVSFNLDSITNGIIEATDSVSLTYNGAVPNFFTNSIAFSPDGELYGWSARNTGSNTDFTGQLYKIDQFSGAITLIGESQGAPYWVNGLAFDSTGTLYGLAANLFSIDTDTGVRTKIGTNKIGQGHRGLAIDFSTDELYAWTGLKNVADQLLAIDKATGLTTNIPIDFDVTTGSVGTEFNPDTGEIVTIRGGSNIYSTDITTGHGTYLGRVLWNGEYIRSNSLTVIEAPIPEPSTMLLLGGGLAGLIAFRKKLKKN